MSSVLFDQQGKLSVITVENDFATAKITPYGANVLSFIPRSPRNMADLLWVSPAARFDGRQPVRGGIPICWPWFGKHASDSTLPAHGFVRNMLWQLDQVNHLESGATELSLSIESSDESLKIWPYLFHLQLVVTVAESLTLRLVTTNLSDHTMVLTEAFHSYFKVGDASKVTVSGLEGSVHIDTLSAMKRSVQTKKLFLSPPMDSVFLNHAVDAKIDDVVLSRQISVRKQGSSSTVVWNPGSEIVKGFKDISNEAWPEFLCVESGNVFEDVVTLLAGEKHELKLELFSDAFVR